MKQYTEPRKS